jgi:hypothetical protein
MAWLSFGGVGYCFLYDEPDLSAEGKLNAPKGLGEPEFNTLTAENRLPTQADGAARCEFDGAARSLGPRAPAISAPPATLPSETPNKAATLTQLSCD